MDDLLKAIRDDHRDFDYGSLEGNFGNEPFSLFKEWYAEALSSSEPEANAFVLSTADLQARPSARILYLKELVDERFIFYTNYQSQKGKELAANPNASMLFFWPTLQRQIRIEGTCSKVSEEISDAYFNSRPHASKIGAWASHQSEGLDNRKDLEERFEKYAEDFKEYVPRPAHWGGYEMKPSYFEFWQGRPSRLHDRIVFEWENSSWTIKRINP